MSLANENDLIIPGTTGVITALKNEANLFNKNSVNKEKDSELLANQIRSIGTVYQIANGRVQGKPLEELVDPSRISSNQERINTSKEEKQTTKEVPVGNSNRFYEDWMGRE